MEEKGNDACKCMRGERVRNSLSFPSFGKRYSGFPFSSFPGAQGPLHSNDVKGIGDTGWKRRNWKQREVDNIAPLKRTAPMNSEERELTVEEIDQQLEAKRQWAR